MLLILTGCSSRIETPVTEADSTIVYPAKNADGIAAKITLFRKMNKKTGKLIGEGTVFTIREKEKIRALIELENRFVYGDRELMFHLDWIGDNGKSFYRKQIDFSPNDSSSTIKTSISIPPDRRQPGNYILRIYLFRELIAEKKFELIPESQIILSKDEEIKAGITLYRRISKKTGKMLGKGTVFTIKKKAKVRALIDLENRFAYGDRELIFHLDWIGEDGKSFYRKGIDLYPDDSSSTIKSSISISPGKRQAGNCILQIFLFNKLIAEKKFELRLEL